METPVRPSNLFRLRRPKALKRFELMGILPDRVLARLGRNSVSEITLDDLAVLLGLYNAIMAHEVTPDSAFPEKEVVPEAPVNLPDTKRKARNLQEQADLLVEPVMTAQGD